MRALSTFLSSLIIITACGGGDDPQTGGASSSGGAGGSAGSIAFGGAAGSIPFGAGGASGAAGGSGGAAGAADPAGTYGLTFKPSFDNCSDLPPLDPSAGGAIAITVDAATVTATFTGWPATEMTPLIGTATLTGTVDGDKLNLESPMGAPMSVGGCTTQWTVAAAASFDGTAVSGSLVFSRGASTSKACTDQGIKPCPRAVTFFGKKN